MLTKVMTWLSLAALAIALYSRSSVADLGITGLVIFIGALAVVVRAVRLREHYWTAGMIAVTVLFNPVAPLPIPRSMAVGLELACILALSASLFALRARPLLSIPSITDRTPGSESL
jgi:ABC-type uncharacterized transport system permease subunit